MRPFCNETSVLKFLENTLYLVGCVLMTMNPEKEIPYMYRCAIRQKPRIYSRLSSSMPAIKGWSK